VKPNTPDDFWHFVEMVPGIECWIWTGKRSGHRYGAFNIGGRCIKAHRFSYELACGPIPDGLHVLHRCDIGFCVRPDHLFLGTHNDNMMDRTAKGRTNPPVGERNAWAKLTDVVVQEIRARYAVGERQVDLAAAFNVDQTTISKIVIGHAWKHINIKEAA